MNYKYFIVCFLFLARSTHAQDCNRELSLFNESAKAELYDDALPRYLKLIKDCPKEDIIIYKRGDKMFDDLLETETDEAATNKWVKLKIDNLKLRLEHMPDESPIGFIYPEIGKTMYDYKLATPKEQFNYFEEAWVLDYENFNSPKGIYTYFVLYNSFEDKGEVPLNDLFAKYDELLNHIERMKDEQASIANTILKKVDNGERISMKESRMLKNSKIYLKNYERIIKGMNKIIGDKANCENIIPIYNEEFDDKKEDKRWLKIAASRMNAEECTSDPLFIQLVDALNTIEPSSKTLMYLGKLSLENKSYDKAIDYFKQALQLSDGNNQVKAKVNFYIADAYKGKKSFSTAKSYYEDALDLKPSLGYAYLNIALMIEESANGCGNTTFEKRAVYWIAEKYANRAAAVDAGLRSNALKYAERYKQLAPAKKDIFTSEKQGETIVFDCWIGGSVKVPEVKKD